MAKEKEIKLVFSSEKYEELKAKIAELDADNTTLIQERNDALKTIADLVEKMNGLNETLTNCNNTHWDNRTSCANKLEQSDLFVYLPDEENNKVNGIIKKLRGKE